MTRGKPLHAPVPTDPLHHPKLAKDVMSTNPVCVSPETTLREFARILDSNEISGCPVVDTEGRVVGVATRTDLIRKCMLGTLDVPPAYLFDLLSEEADEDVESAPTEVICVADFMTEEAVTCRPDDSLALVAKRLVEGRIHRIVVVDGTRTVVGIITTLDLLKGWPG